MNFKNYTATELASIKADIEREITARNAGDVLDATEKALLYACWASRKIRMPSANGVFTPNFLLQAVKHFRQRVGHYSLKEAKDICDAYIMSLG